MHWIYLQYFAFPPVIYHVYTISENQLHNDFEIYIIWKQIIM